MYEQLLNKRLFIVINSYGYFNKKLVKMGYLENIREDIRVVQLFL